MLILLALAQSAALLQSVQQSSAQAEDVAAKCVVEAATGFSRLPDDAQTIAEAALALCNAELSLDYEAHRDLEVAKGISASFYDQNQFAIRSERRDFFRGAAILVVLKGRLDRKSGR